MLQKNGGGLRNIEDDLQEEKSTKQNKSSGTCSVCGKGEMKLVDILNRKFLVCGLCKHREKIK